MNEADLQDLMVRYFNDEVSAIGRRNLETIIEDLAVAGPEGMSFERPKGGHNFDVTGTMSLVVGILQLLVAVGDIVSREMRKKQEVRAEALIQTVRAQISNEDFTRLIGKEDLIADIARRVGQK